MASWTRDQLRAALESEGEQPPRQWTKVELRMRLEEITKKPLTSKGPEKLGKTEYEQMVVLLNKASRKKAELVKFCENRLHMTNVESYTIPRLQQLALVRIYEVTTPDMKDKIGFGKYSEMNYDEVMYADPGYCQWVMETAQRPGTEGCLEDDKGLKKQSLLQKRLTIDTFWILKTFWH